MFGQREIVKDAPVRRLVTALATTSICLLAACTLSGCGAAPGAVVTSAPATSAAAAPATPAPTLGQQLVSDLQKAATFVQATCKDIDTGATTVQMIDPAVLANLKAHNPSTVTTEALVCSAASQVPASSN